jgi:hypothetical protein
VIETKLGDQDDRDDKQEAASLAHGGTELLFDK